MKKAVLLAALSWALMALPGAAYTINLNGADVLDFGEFELLEYLSYSPYELKVINSETFMANPEESPGYHFAEAWTSLEMGLGNGISTSLIVPYDFWRQFDGQDGAVGLYDLTWTLSRKLWDAETHAGRLRLRVDLATGNAERGLGAGVPGLGIEHASEVQIGSQLTAYLNLNYLYRLRRTAVTEDEVIVTAWEGQSIGLHTALEWHVSEAFSLIVEQLGSWQDMGHENRQPVAESGALLLQLAPGVTWKFSDDLAFQASVLLPFVRQGYQDAYRWTAVFGTVLAF